MNTFEQAKEHHSKTTQAWGYLRLKLKRREEAKQLHGCRSPSDPLQTYCIPAEFSHPTKPPLNSRIRWLALSCGRHGISSMVLWGIHILIGNTLSVSCHCRSHFGRIVGLLLPLDLPQCQTCIIVEGVIRGGQD